MDFNRNFYSKIFLSYSTIADDEIKIFFSNALIIVNEKNLSIFHPRDTFNKVGNFIKPKRKIIKKFNTSWSEKSLQNSINYFIETLNSNKKFKIKYFNKCLKVNEIITKS